MSDEGKDLLRELVTNTKANTNATFALLKTIRKLEGEKKKALKSLGIRPKLSDMGRACPVCGSWIHGGIEEELHHTHWLHPDHYGAPHCPCNVCRPGNCDCDYCQIAHDELHGLSDEEIGTPGDLLPRGRD
jgi:hypothetical protein